MNLLYASCFTAPSETSKFKKSRIIKLCVNLRNNLTETHGITLLKHTEFDEEDVLIQLCPEHKYFDALNREGVKHDLQNGRRKMTMKQ
jgi:hypothetical protein